MAATSASGAAAYPARLDARLDLPLSRWLWLVKWILVIPHLVVLGVLWIATTVLTVIAGFAILYTERYPRAIFDFNVGVIRWTWRVAYYAIAGFGTDRYPPFSLASDPTYPADFDVDYPERLSRGLVLVKWWLLAIPHYLVVAAFTGGFHLPVGAGGLVALLSVIAMVFVALQRAYPENLFDFIMAMNRWCYRVLAYAALLRDEYPPFRLDQGGIDPGTAPAQAAAPSVADRPNPRAA
jgi:hypothetical protein